MRIGHQNNNNIQFDEATFINRNSPKPKKENSTARVLVRDENQNELINIENINVLGAFYRESEYNAAKVRSIDFNTGEEIIKEIPYSKLSYNTEWEAITSAMSQDLSGYMDEYIADGGTDFVNTLADRYKEIRTRMEKEFDELDPEKVSIDDRNKALDKLDWAYERCAGKVASEINRHTQDALGGNAIYAYGRATEKILEVAKNFNSTVVTYNGDPEHDRAIDERRKALKGLSKTLRKDITEFLIAMKDTPNNLSTKNLGINLSDIEEIQNGLNNKETLSLIGEELLKRLD